MKIFISQPFHGKTEEEVMGVRNAILVNFAKQYRYGIEEIQVIDNWTAPEDKPRMWYLGRAIQMMSEADVVVFSCDYRYAKGCKIEFEVCKEYGIPYLIEGVSL